MNDILFTNYTNMICEYIKYMTFKHMSMQDQYKY